MKANNGMNQKALADALGVSPPYISSVMSCNENLTVEQMSRLAEAAGGSLHVTVAPKGVYIRWEEDTLEAPATEAAISPSLHERGPVPGIYLLSPLQRAEVGHNLGQVSPREISSPIPERRQLRSPLGPSPLGQKERGQRWIA
jgi:transcriptional regulator with XRE-family HTH domain